MIACLAAVQLAGATALAKGGQVDTTAPESLAAARALFGEALADETAGRLQAALDKFLRVKSVRDTPPVEYRIGTCQEGLGRPAPAYMAYRAAVALGAEDPTMGDVIQASRERVDALSKHVARLTLLAPDKAGPDLAVQVDDSAVGRDALGQPIALEPGTHVVVATTAGRGAFRSRVVLPEGGEASLPIAFADPPAPPPSAAPADSPAPASGSTQALGWVLAGTGAALLVASGVVFWLRHEDIASLGSACPGGICPPTATDAESTRDRALAEGPVAAGLGAAGLAAGAVGGYFILTAQRSAPLAVVAIPTAHGGGLAVAGVFR